MAAIITDFRILSQTKYEKMYDCSTLSEVKVICSDMYRFSVYIAESY
jgi:hypothetical protein